MTAYEMRDGDGVTPRRRGVGCAREAGGRDKWKCQREMIV